MRKNGYINPEQRNEIGLGVFEGRGVKTREGKGKLHDEDQHSRKRIH